MNEERKKELKLFQKLSRIRFKNFNLLNLAFTHRSYANEAQQETENNEKLEFLGDSILGLIISEYLFRNISHKSEGDFAKIKSFVVSEDSLAAIAKKIRVDNFILIGKGEEYSGGRNKKAIIADAMEAIIGAYYIDSGYNPVKEFVLKLLIPEINKVILDKHKKDYKSLLQELVQKKYRSYPKYNIVKKSGPDHDKTFMIEVNINNKIYGQGMGKNKKEAEQKAAGVAYKRLLKQKKGK